MVYVLMGGMRLTEEEMKDAFSKSGFVIFNERDYNKWIEEHIAKGVIKEVIANEG